AVAPPEAPTVAVVDPGDAVRREQQLSQVFPSPPGGPDPVAAQSVEIDQDDSGRGPVSREAVDIQEEVAEVQILVEEASAVQNRGDPSEFGDQLAFQRGEGATIEARGQFG